VFLTLEAAVSQKNIGRYGLLKLLRPLGRAPILAGARGYERARGHALCST
jgi:hypothetical protein